MVSGGPSDRSNPRDARKIHDADDRKIHEKQGPVIPSTGEPNSAMVTSESMHGKFCSSVREKH